MGTLTSGVKKLAKQKQEISKIRRLSEKQFKKAKFTSRKYSSTLTSLEKRVNSSRIQIEDFSQTLNQKIAQLESVQRLKKSAQERLDFETQNKEQLESEIDFSNTEEEKQGTLSRIRIIMGVIDETKNEIKQRASMEKKLTQIIDDVSNSKSKISHKIKKNLESKPELVNLVKNSKNKLETTAKKYTSSKLREDLTKTKLAKISSELSELLRKRAKAKARAEAKAKLKKAKARAEAKAKLKKAKAKPKKAKAKPKKAKAKPKKKKSRR